MARMLVGTLTDSERDEIQQLNYRKQTLQTVFRSLAEESAEFNPRLYERMMDDMVETQRRYDEWFRVKADQYKWESVNGRTWSVDFQSREVYLV